jgi:hypothetical protein
VAKQIAERRGSSLIENARTLALINMAISDGLVSVMETKYEYNFWRPETAIHMAATDGNERTEPDSGFVPFIPTPCFPGYGSAHAAASYAARELLDRTYGNGPVAVQLSSPAVAGVVLRYARLNDITQDIDDARVYGGIHFRFDQEAGAEQGRRIGRYIVRRSLPRASNNACSVE